MFTHYKSYCPVVSPFDPCKPIPEKVYSTPPNLYIGFQPPNLPQFTPLEALKAGTLWKPFYDPYFNPFEKAKGGIATMKQIPAEYYQMLEQLQAVDFVLVELQLYLDTHPDDLEAIKQFNHYAKERKSLKKAFESQFGPLQQFGNSYSGHPWNWNDPPWPWQV